MTGDGLTYGEGGIDICMHETVKLTRVIVFGRSPQLHSRIVHQDIDWGLTSVELVQSGANGLDIGHIE